jgi:hypothetical protein
MYKPRFTVRMLLAAIAVIGSGFAALRFPTYFCTVVTVSILLSALVGSLVTAATCRGAWRAFSISFAIAGWAHFILALTPFVATDKLLLSRYCLDRLAVPLGYAMGPNAYIEETTLRHAIAEYVPGSPPDRYYKYIVIGQSIFTLILATALGALGRCIYQFHIVSETTES